ncbi:MAG: putative zinc-binding metallopeptidase [Bacteroides sp.]|nr:putative zinc-binding metallopeptidase [Bacteroides sp.]MCM1378491.1 putative zinc-binding metallopeptidase [Bacteroides sp.]MCM1444792.1 putative zinc-binding metallopeptidase [Prevotella sp.]
MKISKYLLPALVGLAMVSCSEEEIGPSIFVDPEHADPNGYTYKFDTWVENNFRIPYNLDYKYRMEDIESNMDYNLVPATFDNARDLCLLTKYLWFDTYEEATGSKDFLKTYGPRILHLIGSPAYNPTSGTEILGLAEGGLKVTLFKVNEMQLDNVNMLNEYYFRTMHHEFGHILHQTKSYPTDFNLLSTGLYEPSTWQDKPIGMTASLGFITPYASSETREDFAETIANFLTRTKEQDDMILWLADRGWTTGTAGEVTEAEPKYYCMYYLKDPSNVEEKTYFMQSVEKDEGFQVGVTGLDGKTYNTVAEVEAYIESLQSSIPGGVFFVEDTDKIDGRAIIQQKRSIVRNWFKDAWNLDYDNLRTIVQRRQNTYRTELDNLRAEVENTI